MSKKRILTPDQPLQNPDSRCLRNLHVKQVFKIILQSLKSIATGLDFSVDKFLVKSVVCPFVLVSWRALAPEILLYGGRVKNDAITANTQFSLAVLCLFRDLQKTAWTKQQNVVMNYILCWKAPNPNLYTKKKVKDSNWPCDTNFVKHNRFPCF